jgi:ribosomal-protein-alanine N-acetyltransferase
MENKSEYGYYLDGRHIYLREVRPDDVDHGYYRWMNDPEVMQYLESRYYPHAKESLRDYVRQKQGDESNVFLAIVLKQNNRHIGNIKLGPINWIHRMADIGILIGEKDCWSQGFASEAISLVSTYAFDVLNLRKLTSLCYEANRGSVKAFQNAGFCVEAVRKQHVFFKGTYMDVILLGMIKNE